MISNLKPNEVFIFGSNSTGFHGAGAAGLACRGDSRNTWRTDQWFLKAMKSAVGSPDRIGKWAVYGIPTGFQVGKEGMSYAIKTIEHPGKKRSTPLKEIQIQLWNMATFARVNSSMIFIMTPIGAGLAGYTNQEMNEVWESAQKFMPENVVYSNDLYKSVKILDT